MQSILISRQDKQQTCEEWEESPRTELISLSATWFEIPSNLTHLSNVSPPFHRKQPSQRPSRRLSLTVESNKINSHRQTVHRWLFRRLTAREARRKCFDSSATITTRSSWTFTVTTRWLDNFFPRLMLIETSETSPWTQRGKGEREEKNEKEKRTTR